MTSIKIAQVEINTSGSEFHIFALEDTDKMQGKPEMQKYKNTKPIRTVQESVQTLQHLVQVQEKLFKGQDNQRIT